MLVKLIKQEAKQLNGKYQNIFIGGHSQGACLSLYTVYSIKELLGGVISCSGVLFPEVEIVFCSLDMIFCSCSVPVSVVDWTFSFAF